MRLSYFEIAQTLLSNEQIKVERSCPGIETCILEKAYKQLSDDRFYHQIDQDVTQHKEVTNGTGQAISTCELPPQAKHLTVEHPRNSTCSLIQVGNSGRPLVSACSCPNSNVSTYLNR